MGYKRYEKYKDSGVEWIGEIPGHWDITKVKYICSEYAVYGLNETADNYEDDGVRLIRTTDINGFGNLDDKINGVFISEEKAKGYFLKTGDILLSRSGSLGLSLYFDEEKYGKCSYASYLVKFRTNRFNCPRYLFYFTKSDGFYHQIQTALVSSTISNFNGQKYANIKLPLPSYFEQTAIANFLDQKTADIDSLIADKEKLIQLLKEKRQAIISEAVTKGLGLNASMKDSGVEWIGEIPEHWEVKRIKHLLVSKKDAIKPGPFGSQLKSDEMQEGEIKVYNQRNVLDDDFINGDNYISYGKYQELRIFTVYPGDILVTTRGTIGKVGILPKDCEMGILHPCLIKLQVDNSKVIPEYLQLIFNNTNLISNQLFYQSNATTIEVIYSDTLKNIAIPLPDTQEQMLVLENINKINILFEELIKNIQTQIAKLKEYRQSLISEAVTGKIDVRDYQFDQERAC